MWKMNATYKNSCAFSIPRHNTKVLDNGWWAVDHFSLFASGNDIINLNAFQMNETSTAHCARIWTTFAENPHCGFFGSPFMNSTTWLSWISFFISSMAASRSSSWGFFAFGAVALAAWIFIRCVFDEIKIQNLWWRKKVKICSFAHFKAWNTSNQHPHVSKPRRCVELWGSEKKKRQK